MRLGRLEIIRPINTALCVVLAVMIIAAAANPLGAAVAMITILEWLGVLAQ